MKLFLCSHFSSVGSLIKEEIDDKKVAFIPTASLREGYTGYIGSARKLFKKLRAIVTEIDISTEAYSTIQSVFEDADVIYFTGGFVFPPRSIFPIPPPKRTASAHTTPCSLLSLLSTTMP